MASSDTDAATQALIAQMIAEDFGEAYDNQNRPVGSWYGDYEDPLTSYERRCIDNPDEEDSDDQGWGAPTPQMAPETEESSSPLPEGMTWDSRVTEDERLESTSYVRGGPSSNVDQNDREQDEQHEDDGADEDEKSVDIHAFMDLDLDDKDGIQEHADGGKGMSVEQPSHHLHDPIHYHDLNNATKQSPRHVSQPNHELRSPSTLPRRIASDPPQIETTIHENYHYPPMEQWSHASSPPSLFLSPKLSAKRPAPEPISLPVRLAKSRKLSDTSSPTSPPALPVCSAKPLRPSGSSTPTSPHSRPTRSAKSSKPSNVFTPFSPPSLTTNERLLDFYPSDVDISLDHSRAKNKGKAPEDRQQIGKSVGRHMRSRHERIGHASSKNKAKARATNDSDSDMSDLNLNTDPKSGLPFLKVPWPGSTREDRRRRELAEKQVAEIRVGDEETLDTILMDIARKAKGKGVANGVLCF